MRHKWYVFSPLVILITSLVWAEEAPRLLDKETFMEMESIRGPSISPKGDQIIFSRSWVDKMKDRYRSNLWIVDVDGDRVRELTHGDWQDSSPVWSPDGTRIAFLSDRDGSDQIHVMWLDNREVAQLTHLQKEPQDICWSPGGDRIAFTLQVPDRDPILKVELPKMPKGSETAEPATIVDRLTWARDGRGPVPRGFRHVYVIDARLGGTARQITDGKYNHGDPQWSADGNTIYVSGIRKPDAEYLRNDSEIYAFNLKTGQITALTDRLGPDRGMQVSPDGKWISYVGYDDKKWTRHLSNIYLMDNQGGGKRLWISDLANLPNSISWAADSSGVYFVVGERGSHNLYFAPLDGNLRQITKGVHVLSNVTLASSGQAAGLVADFHRPSHLVTFPVDDAGGITELVDVNQDVLGGLQLGNVEELWFKSSDGWDVQGWLVYPANFDPAKKYPLVMWIHGGPWAMYSVGFNWSFQNFAAEGYALLYVNPRGSTGYGQDFVNGIQYSYPGKDFDDLMAAVDRALEKGWVDPENMFVCGGSGGGVLTAWIVGHTDRFRAAVSMRPVINWHSFVGTTDGPSWYDQFQKYPWEDPMEYALRSPLHYVGNVTTPTMVMTGEADLRTPMTQSEEYYRALKILKKETLLVRVPGEYHGWRRPTHRLLQQLYLQAWFDKYRTDKLDEKAEAKIAAN